MAATTDHSALLELLSDDKKPIPHITQALVDPVHKAATTSEEATETAFSSTWQNLLHCASSTPYFQQQKLVNVLQSLQQVPSGPQNAKGETCSVWGNLAEWKNLPLFGPAVRDFWNLSPDDRDDSQTSINWPNLNAFIAQITSISQPGDPFDFSLYGIWSLRLALEDSPPGRTSRAHAQAAAIWMIYAADALFQRSREKEAYQGNAAREGSDLQGKNWKGYNEERWKIWKERFLVLRGKYAGDEETGKLVEEAIAKMEEAERKK